MKLKVTVHSSQDEKIVEVESFDAAELTSQRNDNTIEAIQIGNHSFSRIDLKNVEPFEEVSDEDVQNHSN
ncbi:MAG: hypothetical protein AB2401_08765 [Bacillus sp. (in: firmicutes)]